MRKRVQIGILSLVAASVLFIVFSGYSQDEMTTVNDTAFEEMMRPAVPFAHDEHNEAAGIEECYACHHVYEDGKLMEDESSEDLECSECHSSEDGKYPMNLVKVFHLLCQGCHLEKKEGPILCGECHPRD